MTSEPDDFSNLTKYLSRSGRVSRRQAAVCIKAGRVKVNGAVITDPATPVAPSDRVELDGSPIVFAARRYVMLYKPRGYVCSNADRHAAKLAVDLIPAGERLFSAGRLDQDSEGLLIFSNDGDYVLRLTHPRYEILKEYEVVTDRALTPGELQKLRQGIRDAGEFLHPRRIDVLAPQRYRFVLNEGKKREIRRLIASCDVRVTRLIRYRTGSLDLGGLTPGGWRELTPAEIAASQRNPAPEN